MLVFFHRNGTSKIVELVILMWISCHSSSIVHCDQGFKNTNETSLKFKLFIPCIVSRGKYFLRGYPSGPICLAWMPCLGVIKLKTTNFAEDMCQKPSLVNNKKRSTTVATYFDLSNTVRGRLGGGGCVERLNTIQKLQIYFVSCNYNGQFVINQSIAFMFIIA